LCSCAWSGRRLRGRGSVSCSRRLRGDRGFTSGRSAGEGRGAPRGRASRIDRRVHRRRRRVDRDRVLQFAGLRLPEHGERACCLGDETHVEAASRSRRRLSYRCTNTQSRSRAAATGACSPSNDSANPKPGPLAPMPVARAASAAREHRSRPSAQARRRRRSRKRASSDESTSVGGSSPAASWTSHDGASSLRAGATRKGFWQRLARVPAGRAQFRLAATSLTLAARLTVVSNST